MKTRRTERAGKAVGGGGVSWGGRVAYFKEGKHKQEEMRRLEGDITKKKEEQIRLFFLHCCHSMPHRGASGLV